ncbi:hypothetical protein FNF29_00370 [Cafeteria roenbergensis]|uniref:Glutamyl-tRNA(Gln) amidotransferase subunit B, mitochondrial n=1 Tax=Cafeteria roenbergensis TaxID=33653 RepID=A0A5A8CWB2_CAFRO|nr:hypothetical protein FNF29_00370 [Cafeteria roenbergensis]|eukprot:KAA0157018.1 hypothetical protein FNF29_00370 [Cafeteria roenbergensis]
MRGAARAAVRAVRPGVAPVRGAASASGVLEGSGGRIWDLCVGLEVHAQILSSSKLFSGAPSAGSTEAAWAGPNDCVALFDAALPGALPVVNRHCVLQAVRAGLMLGGEVQPVSVFERKHYFYADLPSGYQITQNRMPIVRGGQLTLEVPTGKKGRDFRREVVRLDRIQLEQDSGKSSHTLDPERSLVDLGRAGVALIEVVTFPDLTSAESAAAFLRKMQAVLRHGGVCDGNMELGSMRCDVNVSLTERGGEAGERVEMKNLASVRAVARAVEHEAQRQLEMLDAAAGRGDTVFRVPRETRSFDMGSGQSARLRGKEDAPDYRFLPDPDLAPLRVGKAFVDRARATLPEDLDALRQRLTEAPIGLSEYDAGVIVGAPGGARFFEQALLAARSLQPETASLGKTVCGWLTTEVLGRLNDAGAALIDTGAGSAGGEGQVAFRESDAGWDAEAEAEAASASAASPAAARWWSDKCPISPEQLGHVAGLVDAGEISGAAGKRVVALLFGEARRGQAADAAEAAAARASGVVATVDRLGLRQVSDDALVRAWCEAAVKDPSAAAALDKLAKGRDRAMGALVGMAIKQSGGKANPSRVAQLMPEVAAAALEARASG